MSSGLLGLLDDVAALAKLAAASLDDIGASAGRASVKAAGVVVDDTAVTPAYVHGLAADRELPIITRIAKGSLKNKLLYIIPVALVLSEFVPVLVEIVLMFGVRAPVPYDLVAAHSKRGDHFRTMIVDFAVEQQRNRQF